MGRRSSPVWLVKEDTFRELVANASCVKDVVDYFGIRVASGNYKTIRARIEELGLDYTALARKGLQRSAKGARARNTVGLEELLVNGDFTLWPSAKRRIINSGLLGPKVCVKCGTGTEWQGFPITLQLDHINGNPKDHRLENLRLLCPNCHSQTETWGCKRRGGPKPKIAHICVACPQIVSKAGNMCRVCAAKNRHSKDEHTKITWPSHAELRAMLEKSNYLAVGRELGVSDNAVRNRLRNHPD